MLFTFSILESFHDCISIKLLSYKCLLSWFSKYNHKLKYVNITWSIRVRQSLLSCSVCQLNCLRTSNKLSLGGVDTSKTYLLFWTLLFFWSLTCIIWMQLTRTNIVFSRITLAVYFCAEIHFPEKFPEIHQNSIFTEDPRSPKDNWTGATGPPEGDQVRTSLGRASWASGSPGPPLRLPFGI